MYEARVETTREEIDIIFRKTLSQRGSTKEFRQNMAMQQLLEINGWVGQVAIAAKALKISTQKKIQLFDK